MRRITKLLMIAGWGFALMNGCANEASPIVGGTSGTLTSDGQPMSEVELSFYPDSSSNDALPKDAPVAYGAVRSDGTFELINASRTAAMRLEAGGYRVTIESLGAEVNLSPQYTDPGVTKLRVEHFPPAPIAIDIPGLSEGM